MFVFTAPLVALALILLAIVLVVLGECVLGVLPVRDTHAVPELTQPRAVVLVPAHDEEAGIEQTIVDLKRDLDPQDRVLVIADNCTDETAKVARRSGAEVIERAAPERRGKGYAISFGVESLEADPPDVLVIVDADCVLVEGSLPTLIQRAHETGRPVQAEYLFAPPHGSGMAVVSALATIVRNQARPRGLLRLGLPCHLTGSGMAIPWFVMEQCPPMHGYIVEDMLMGIEFALLGHPPLHCPSAGVRSLLPERDDAAIQQRTRWEHGHLMTALDQVPRLLSAGLSRGSVDLIAMGVDLLVPPLALLLLLHLALCVPAIVVGALLGSWFAFKVTIASLVLLTAAVLLSWSRFGRPQIPLRHIAQVPGYVLKKIPIYLSFLRGRRESDWRRTER